MCRSGENPRILLGQKCANCFRNKISRSLTIIAFAYFGSLHIIIIFYFLHSSRYPGDGGASYTTATTASVPVVGEEGDPYLHTPPANNHSMPPREAYQPPAPAPPAESYQPSAAAGISRYPGLAMEQRKMHLAGDYYRSQVNLQQQQQQQLEKPADMLAHDHYLGESDDNYTIYLTGSDWLTLSNCTRPYLPFFTMFYEMKKKKLVTQQILHKPVARSKNAVYLTWLTLK